MSTINIFSGANQPNLIGGIKPVFVRSLQCSRDLKMKLKRGGSLRKAGEGSREELTTQVQQRYTSFFFHIRAFRHIRPALTQEMANSVAVSLVTSRLDYANSLLFGPSQANLNKLQRIQNTLAKLVDPNHSHSSDALQTLHWLPVRQRINFKITTLTFKLLQHNSPVYLASLIQPYVPSRALRSHGQQLLAQSHVKTSVGSSAFRAVAPKIWNSLPLLTRLSPSFESFKRALKTHFFTTQS